jgi:hypothetical protein
MLKSQFKIKSIKRIILSVIFLWTAFILPWWLVIVFGLILVFYFKNFYEFIIAGLILDGLYGSVLSIEKFSFIFTLSITILTVFLINFKKKLLIK